MSFAGAGELMPKRAGYIPLYVPYVPLESGFKKLWTCGYCKSKLSSDLTTCCNCGAPKGSQ